MRKGQPVAHIMVVDDDPDTVAIVSRYLQREGFAAVPAGSGAECLLLAKVPPIDVILLDLMMPDMDGFSVCRALKANPATAEIPIIMLTARDDRAARTQGIELGVSDFISKPVSRRDLVSRIQTQLDMLALGRDNQTALRELDSARRS